MPYFKVMMHGDGIRIVEREMSADVVGFFTTRLVRAASAEAAEHKAKAMLIREWSSPPYNETNVGETPRIRVESVTETSFVSSLRFKNSGHTFYTSEEE